MMTDEELIEVLKAENAKLKGEVVWVSGCAIILFLCLFI
jgi:hypothetical protein